MAVKTSLDLMLDTLSGIGVTSKMTSTGKKNWGMEDLKELIKDNPDTYQQMLKKEIEDRILSSSVGFDRCKIDPITGDYARDSGGQLIPDDEGEIVRYRLGSDGGIGTFSRDAVGNIVEDPEGETIPDVNGEKIIRRKKGFTNRIAEGNARMRYFVQSAIVPGEVTGITDKSTEEGRRRQQHFEHIFAEVLEEINCMSFDAADVVVGAFAQGAAGRTHTPELFSRLCSDLDTPPAVAHDPKYVERKLLKILASRHYFKSADNANKVWNSIIDPESTLLKNTELLKMYGKLPGEKLTLGTLLLSYAKNVRDAQVNAFWEQRINDHDQTSLPNNSPNKIGNMLGKEGKEFSEKESGAMTAQIRPTSKEVTSGGSGVPKVEFRGFGDVYNKYIKGTVAGMFDGIQTQGLVSKLTGIDFNVSAEAYAKEKLEDRAEALRKRNAKRWERQHEEIKQEMPEGYADTEYESNWGKIKEYMGSGVLPSQYAGTKFEEFWNETQIEMRSAKIQAMKLAVELEQKRTELAKTMMPSQYEKSDDYKTVKYKHKYFEKRGEVAEGRLREAIVAVSADAELANNVGYFIGARMDILNLVEEYYAPKGTKQEDKDKAKAKLEANNNTILNNYFSVEDDVVKQVNGSFNKLVQDTTIRNVALSWLKSKYGNTNPSPEQLANEENYLREELFNKKNPSAINDFHNMLNAVINDYDRLGAPDETGKQVTKKEAEMDKFKKSAIKAVKTNDYEKPIKDRNTDGGKQAGMRALGVLIDYCAELPENPTDYDTDKKKISYEMIKTFLGLSHRSEIRKEEIDKLLNGQNRDGLKFNPHALKEIYDALNAGLDPNGLLKKANDAADKLLIAKFGQQKDNMTVRSAAMLYKEGM